ncbi:UNVERIFIED_CONTAM: Histone-lysine N-methyltransferase EZA1, partial [Sesamum radiatum]
EKLEKNSTRVQAYVSDFKALAASRNDFNVVNDSVNFLSLRMDSPLCKVSGLNQGSVDRDNIDNEEVVFSTTAKLPLIEKLPPYTTWIFLDRNQRMADDQSVVGRRRIYYDQHGSEALICSDSEEELGEPEGEKHEFSEVENRILRVALEEFGVGDEVLNTLTQFVEEPLSRSRCIHSHDMQERCNMFMEKDRIMGKHKLQSSGEEGSEDNVFLDKSLSAALDSFDNLFCRRCLVFDCRLHGCSQILIYPLNGLKDLPKRSAVPLDGSQSKAPNEEGKALVSLYPIEQVKKRESLSHNVESKGKHRIYESTSSLAKASKVASDDLLSSSNKRLKLGVQDPLDHSTTTVDQFPEVAPPDEHELQMSTSTPLHDFYKHNVDALREACNTIGNSIEAPHRRSEWKTFEKDLYLKGLEIFGRNRCSKSCKNRFRGCHCAKSQCKSRQCPCFAAGRECDPDVCRNCWVSCGDGSLGEPPKRGDGQCGNMRLLLRQQQRILLSKSDVAGWGAFLKYVLDAYRKGDKLKFANHSSTPNCYAKVMLVAGDHRVGIFANERIEAGEELFYDYRYGPDQAPAWARKPEGSSKRDDSLAPQGRAKKHQSG